MRQPYELPLPLKPAGPDPGASLPAGAGQSFEPLLLANVTWYCELRWVVIAILSALGAVSFLPDFMHALGLKSRITWPFALAGILLLTNAFFLAHIRVLKQSGDSRGIRRNLKAQIGFDLVVVTLTVHQAGSVETTIAFLYLFHIVLSCIFLPRVESLAVTLIACALYAGCVGLETGGLLPPSTLYENDAVRAALNAVPGFPLIHIGSVEVTFMVVWFLTSRLSTLLRTREKDLMETNRRLLFAQTERMRFMLQTTHELKAPFAAIQANTQLLLKGYCGELNSDALEIVRRIHERSHRLAGMIQEMLQLANLRSQSEGPLRRVPVSVASALLSSIEQVRPIAEEHRVTLLEELQQADSLGVEDHLKVLFINLLKNAIQYSRKGGEVRVRCSVPPGSSEPQVVIEDRGIGIASDKLPRIFDEYYRTSEAVAHNKDSTGLGLAIVRHIAETHRIRLRVESAPGEGTVFTLRFPSLPGG